MQRKKGFTLIEVVVVTIIIAALALLVMPSFKNSALTNQMEKAKIGLVELTAAVKLYNEVHPRTPLSGIFKGDMYLKLTQIDNVSGYSYLQNPGRWVLRNGSSEEYSLRDSTAPYGMLFCRYEIAPTSEILSQAKCKFNKVDREGEFECYQFYIYKENPAITKKDEVSCEGLYD